MIKINLKKQSCRGLSQDDMVTCRKCGAINPVKAMPKTPTGFRFTCKPCLHAKSLSNFHMRSSCNRKNTISDFLDIVNRPDHLRSHPEIDNIVCSSDGEIYRLYYYNALFSRYEHGQTSQALGKRGYYSYIINRKSYYTHRLIAESFFGSSSLHVNHINGIKTDNSVANLEYVTIKGNLAHAKIFIKNKKKAYRHNTASGRVWYSRIQVDGKDIYLGSFLSKEEAVTAFDNAEKVYFKEYYDRYEKVPTAEAV
jgi:hypothetical protein